ncbi:GntR family transcriptional regulator [Terrarubrum flagellatum]|uniref:GntR family transcriptional regulator n=1 Tax=Terrirubrum flagellatum TaxID=2895980 RepID=UPI0031452B7A
MEDLDTLSQAERAYRRLRSEIIRGELMPGERLRAAELQDRFQLGLTPIREALMRLSSENLVEVETNRGSRVTDASLAEFADLMATRRAIERLCLTAAMEHGDASWEADIIAAMHLLSRTPLPASMEDRDAAARWEAQHRRFHFALVVACGSDWLLRFWNMLADHSERYRKIRLLRHREAQAEVRDVNAEHAAIMEAVIARDGKRATSLMDAHLAATETSVARLLDPTPTR